MFVYAYAAALWLLIGAVIATYSYATAMPDKLRFRDVVIGWTVITLLWPLALLPFRS